MPIPYKMSFKAERYFENEEVEYTDESATEEFASLLGGFDECFADTSEEREEYGRVTGYDVTMTVEHSGEAPDPDRYFPEGVDSLALWLFKDFLESSEGLLAEVERMSDVTLEFSLGADAPSFTYPLRARRNEPVV